MLWGLVDNGMLQRAKYHNITLLINRAIITMILQSSSPLSESDYGVLYRQQHSILEVLHCSKMDETIVPVLVN